MTTFEAELQRKLNGVLVDWPLTEDLEAPDGVSDSVVDAGARARLIEIRDALADILAGLETAVTGLPFSLEATQKKQVGPYNVPIISTKSTGALETLLTPEPGGRLRVRRVWVKGAYNLADGVGVEFRVKLGDTVIAHDDVIASQPYADGVVKEGDVDAPLTIELLVPGKVFYNISVEEMVP